MKIVTIYICLGDNGKVEVEADKYGKALYIIVYKRNKNGTISVSKSVQDKYIYENIDTGLNHYPLVWLNWDSQKNTYHGKGIVEEMVPNQISINKMFAMVIYHLMLTAFPTAVYNAERISSWNNEIGAQIPLYDMKDGESIRNLAGYLEPASMSNQITYVIEMAIKYTKECMGITDASLRSSRP